MPVLPGLRGYPMVTPAGNGRARELPTLSEGRMCRARARTALWSRWPGTHCSGSPIAGSHQAHNQIPVKPGGSPASAGRLLVDLFECVFDSVRHGSGDGPPHAPAAVAAGRGPGAGCRDAAGAPRPARAAAGRLVARQEWAGIGTGHGRLRARRVQVVADGRGVAARSRTRWLWLPGPDGSVGAADQLTIPAPNMRDTG